jgi:xanthine dehydrogenase accessory factor
MLPKLIMIKGAGDLASGVAHRLWFCGFNIVMLELNQPLVVRTNVSFASAVYEKSVQVESVKAVFCEDTEQASTAINNRSIPVLIDPEAKSLELFKPSVLVDGIMAKGNRLTRIDEAELVIGLGPGFSAGVDAHAVIETKRGHELGKVIYSGQAAEDTKEPGKIEGYGRERLLRAPQTGIFKPFKQIGDLVKKGDQVASVDGNKIYAQIDGLIRGMLYEGLEVNEGTKVGDIDPRGASVNYETISDKARAIGGGALEAILHRYNFHIK